MLLPFSTFSQDEPKDTLGWEWGGLTSLTFTQVSLYQWSAGGEPSLAAAALGNLFFNYRSENASFENTLDLGYGFNRQGSEARKANDRIELNSKYGRNISKHWSLSGLLNFRTQFTEGFSYEDNVKSDRISTFMAPGYLTTTLGLDYKPVDNFSIFISPVAGKFTFLMDDSLSAAGEFGVDPGDKFRAELGGFVKITYAATLVHNVDLSTKLDLFTNYLEEPTVDVQWEVLLSMKINEFLSATLNTVFIYDDDVNVPKSGGETGPGWQIKEVFGVGLSYKF